MNYIMNQLYQSLISGPIILDKSTYITTILSILMVYGIFISFLQFATASCTNKNKYMGNDLYVLTLFNNRKIKLLQGNSFKIISMYILIVPLIKKILEKAKLINIVVCNILILLWITFIVVISIMFFLTLVNCVKAIIIIMLNDEERILERSADEVNKKYLKILSKQLSPEKFEEDIKYIATCWNKDMGIFYSKYLNLVRDLLDVYKDKYKNKQHGDND